jgi:NitT/TauT family transport system ATP-binding protein
MNAIDPSMRGFSFDWRSDLGASLVPAAHEVEGINGFERSPLYVLLAEGRTIARWRLHDDPDAAKAVPALLELRAEGGTDYVLHLIWFAPGTALKAITNRQLTVDRQAIAGPSPERGMVFQQHTPFPWKKVRENVAFGPKKRGIGKAERLRSADDILGLVGLTGFEGFYPSQLSGGMQQRVEIARVLINQLHVLLMDEPFGALDAQTRAMMHGVLLDIWTKIPATTLFVTHDVGEALFLADRVIMMSARPGRVIEDIRVPFARPRRPELVTEIEFGRLKRHFLELLRIPGHTAPLPRLNPLGMVLWLPVFGILFLAWRNHSAPKSAPGRCLENCFLNSSCNERNIPVDTL